MSTQLPTKLAVDQWHSKIKDTNNLLSKITDEQLLMEVSPGRNTGTYILGHLVAVHDRMLPLLNLGERIHPELDEIYLENPDKAKPQTLTGADLRDLWNKINAELATQFITLTEQEWLQRHTAVSEEAFEKEPHRNRLNVLLNRTNHLSYHQGQLALLKI
ncbi:MAG: DinB family protein [Saprospiraceae bacterium]